jgi:hypothetical protein
MLTFVRRAESSLKEPTTNFSILGVWEPHLDNRLLRLAGSSGGGLFLLSLPPLVLYVFRRFRKIAKSDYKLPHMSVRLSALNNSASTGRIIMKFDNQVFF